MAPSPGSQERIPADARRPQALSLVLISGPPGTYSPSYSWRGCGQANCHPRIPELSREPPFRRLVREALAGQGEDSHHPEENPPSGPWPLLLGSLGNDPQLETWPLRGRARA
ncbi:hypothetical protein H1C71_018891 [Ictidomys tridecemlineatus]|nr:hypothetical protein H1C71_018891 [Ictidomys tridecemlineatus]